MKNHIPIATVEIKNYTAHESSGKVQPIRELQQTNQDKRVI